LDVLPSQASSVPCERIFSSAKLTATDRRSRLKADVFEILQIMKSTWRDRLINLAEANDDDLEECADEYMNFLIAEDEWETWEQEGHTT
jgi:hAT family protein